MFGGIQRLLYIGVHQWRSVLLVGVLMVGIGGGLAAVTKVPTQEDTVPDSVGTVTVEQQHHARAVENASLYEPGELVRGKSLYLRSDLPTATIQEVVRIDGGPPTPVKINTRVQYLTHYSNSVVYREQGRSVHKSGTIADGNVTAALTLNMTRVRHRVGTLQSQFGSETSVQVVLRTRVSYGSQLSESIVYQTPISFTSKSYHIPSRTEQAQYGTFETIRQPVPERTVSIRGIFMSHLQLAGLVLALLGLCFVGVSAGYLRRMTGVDKEELYREVMHRRFQDLIATVEAGDCPTVDRQMMSLQDLVYVSEDGGEPILYFPGEEWYIVQDDGVVYGYQFGVLAFLYEEKIDD